MLHWLTRQRRRCNSQYLPVRLLSMALVLLVLIPASFAGPHIPLSSSFSVNLTTRNFGLQFLHAAKDHFNDPSHATFTLTNGSQLWYSLNINSAPAGLKVTTADPVNDIVGT